MLLTRHNQGEALVLFSDAVVNWDAHFVEFDECGSCDGQSHSSTAIRFNIPLALTPELCILLLVTPLAVKGITSKLIPPLPDSPVLTAAVQ